MAEEYRRRYGKDWTWFTTLVDMDIYNVTPREDLESDPTVRLVFTGSIGKERWKELAKLGKILEELSLENIKTRLVIYTSADFIRMCQHAFKDLSTVELRPWIPASQLPAVYCDSDVLVHVESSDQEMLEYTRLSLSTKISQYMMAGRCILAIGTPEHASCRIVEETDSGVLIQMDDRALAKKELRELFASRTLLMQYGKNGRKHALDLFEGRKKRAEFRSLILDTIKSHQMRGERTADGV